MVEAVVRVVCRSKALMRPRGVRKASPAREDVVKGSRRSEVNVKQGKLTQTALACSSTKNGDPLATAGGEAPPHKRRID